MQSNQSNAPVPVNAYGATTGTVSTTPLTTVLSTRNPTTYDFNYPVKQRWINTLTASEFVLISFSNITGQNLATWLQITSEIAALETLTANSGGPVGVDSHNNINVVGDGTTINIVGNPSTHTLTASLVGGLSAIETIQGDSGSVTGNTIQLYANTGSANTGSSVKFSAVSSTEMDLIVTDSLVNTIIGKGSGNSSLSGNSNVSLGGRNLTSLTSGSANTTLGYGAGFKINSGSSNTVLGVTAASMLTTGNLNTFIGSDSGSTIITGYANIFIGHHSGSNYTGAESSNILIGNSGTALESNVIRIGTSGSNISQQNKSFMAGVTGVTAVGSPMAISSTGQMSDLGFGTTGQLLTSNGAGVSPTWQTKITTGKTFTPVLAFGGSSTGITYTTQLGNYTVLGNLVFFNLEIILSSKGSATGTATVSGLPFAVGNFTSGANCTLTTFTSNIPANTFSVWGILSTGTSYITPQYATTGSPSTGSSWDNTLFTNTTVFRLQGFYQYF